MKETIIDDSFNHITWGFYDYINKYEENGLSCLKTSKIDEKPKGDFYLFFEYREFDCSISKLNRPIFTHHAYATYLHLKCQS